MVTILTCVSLFCRLRWPRSSDTSVAMSTPGGRISVLNTILQKRSQRSREKWLVLGPRQEIYTMSLQCLVCQKGRKSTHNTHPSTVPPWWEDGCQQPKLRTVEQENEVVLDYNPKCKINLHESTLLYIHDSLNRWGKHKWQESPRQNSKLMHTLCPSDGRAQLPTP